MRKLAVEKQTVRNGGLGAGESFRLSQSMVRRGGCHPVVPITIQLQEETRTATTLVIVVAHHMRTSGLVIKPFSPPVFQSTEILDGLMCIPSWKCCGKGNK